MITETLISTVLSTLAGSAGAKKAGSELSTATWNFIRPLFLKDDPAEGAKELAAAEAAPAAAETQEKVASLLKDHLSNNPEAANQLQQILQQHGGTVINNNAEVKNQFNNGTFNNTTFN